jgi:hypothetical protein
VGSAERQVTRRTWLEWLGRSAVLALSAELTQACGAVGEGGGDAARADLAALLDAGAGRDGGRPPRADAGAGDARRTDERAPPDGVGADARAADGIAEDGGATDAAPDAADAGAADVGDVGDVGDAGDAGFPFRPGPGDDPVFRGWGERTVDRQDLAAILAGWELRVDGLVEAPQTLTFADLLALPRQDQVTDFHCVEGWSIRDVPWNGVHLAQLLARVRPLPTATHVVFHTLGGIYNESLPRGVALEPRTLLAYGVAGSTLPLAHGFPLRVVIPRLLGYKSAKYVHRIELADARLDGFWVRYGYPYDAEVPPGRLREGKY